MEDGIYRPRRFGANADWRRTCIPIMRQAEGFKAHPSAWRIFYLPLTTIMLALAAGNASSILPSTLFACSLTSTTLSIES